MYENKVFFETGSKNDSEARTMFHKELSEFKISICIKCQEGYFFSIKYKINLLKIIIHFIPRSSLDIK